MQKVKAIVIPIATKDLVSRFAGMVAVNHFDEADFRPWLLESITYSCGSLSVEQQEWLTYLSLANSLLPGTIPGALKVKLIEDGKELRRNSVNLEKLIAYRTSGLNMPNLRLQLSALSFRRFEVLKAASVECPVNVENIAHDMDINELAGDICDNFSRLVPALFQALRKDLPDNALRESFFADGEGQHSLLDKMIGHLFYGNTAPDTEIRSLLAPQENTIDDDLALFLRGGLGGAFFKQVGELMMESENNAIYCSLSKLTRSDWNQILPG